MPLRPQTVADFYKEYLGCLAALGVEVKIDPMPCEVANPIRFDLDTEHKSYDAEYAQRFWRVLVQAEKVFRQFGTGFLGKVSPIHFFWGSFDLAVTRFSGRPAPPRDRGGSAFSGRPTRTRSSARDSGREMEAMARRRSIAMRLRCRRGWRRRRFARRRRDGIRPWESSSSSTTTCGREASPETGADGVSGEHVCGGGGCGEVGSRGAGTAVATGLSADVRLAVTTGCRACDNLK